MNKEVSRLNRILIFGLLLGLLFSLDGANVRAQGENWTVPRVISAEPDASTPVFAWFPDITVDEFGNPHVVWCRTSPAEGGGLVEQVGYTRLDDSGWTSPNDIVPPSPDIERNAIAADWAGNVHLLYGGSAHRSLALYHKTAPIDGAESGMAWSKPHRINQGISYMGDIAVDSRGVVHVVYDDTIFYEGEESFFADIFYRRSTDGGLTWSQPFNLNLSPGTGSSRPQLEIAPDDTLLVSWDEGWDRLSGQGVPESGFFTVSVDGGRSWMPPTQMTFPDSTVAQLSVGSDGEGGVMLVWRSTSRAAVYFQWSDDGGYSWQPPAALPGIFARRWGILFDVYDMAADSDGIIHLLVVGRESADPNAVLGVYHLQWNGSEWLSPERIFVAGGLLPEYPKMFISEGNQLHAVWFTREGSEFEDFASREVWYARGQLDASHSSVTPRPTATAVPPTPTPTEAPRATPLPTLGSEDTGLPGDLKTEYDDLARLALALLPLVLIILIVMVLRTGRVKRL